jgi:hypothetical protein
MDADMIAVDGNPLEDLGALRGEMWIMKGGRVIDFPPRESWPHEQVAAAVAARS